MVKTAEQAATTALSATQKPITQKLNSEQSDWIERNWAFRTFSEPDLSKMASAALQLCKDARESHFEALGRVVTFSGMNGNGKTHLAKSVFRYLHALASGETMLVRSNHFETPDCRFFHWPSVTKKMLQGEWAIEQAICQCWFCVIDDFGAEHDPTGVFASTVSRIIDKRVNKWTLITTNLDLQSIADIDRRISSRLIRGNNLFFKTNCKDYSMR